MTLNYICVNFLVTGAVFRWAHFLNLPFAMWGVICYLLSFLTGIYLYKTYTPKKPEEIGSPSKSFRKHQDPNNDFTASRPPRYCNFVSLKEALDLAGLHDAHLMVGIDFTASNEWQGRRTFNQQCLHHVSALSTPNPYQCILLAIGTSLAPMMTSHPIAAYGFGDQTTKDFSVFSLRQDSNGNDAVCDDVQQVLACYKHAATSVILSGPTSFVPIIRKCIELVQETKQYHILLIVADGKMTDQEFSTKAIVEASKYPISIIMVGVGDGPWDSMLDFESSIRGRKFSNFHFVDYHRAISACKNTGEALLLATLSEVPDQYRTIKKLGYIDPEQKQNSESKIRRESSIAVPEKELFIRPKKHQRLGRRFKNSLRVVDSKLTYILPKRSPNSTGSVPNLRRPSMKNHSTPKDKSASSSRLTWSPDTHSESPFSDSEEASGEVFSEIESVSKSSSLDTGLTIDNFSASGTASSAESISGLQPISLSRSKSVLNATDENEKESDAEIVEALASL